MSRQLPAGAHVFIDETKAREFILVGTWVSASDVTVVRRAVRTLAPHNARRLHFKKLTDAQRDAALRVICNLPIAATASRSVGSTGLADRDRCLGETITLCHDSGASRVVIERDDSAVAHDLAAVRTVTRSIEVHHLTSADEPCLWLSDAIAWCIQRGGRWAAQVAPLMVKMASRHKAGPDRRP
ncbi:hypothetical protein [Microbacterium sp.]|uniref:hypothetical protein n=1 Tax=Microbacterium sp. TaxID=51671 RepID=UPI0039E2BCE5